MADLTAAEIVTAVRRHYACETDGIGPEWAALDEMDLQPGYSTRRIDLLLVRAWRGKQGHVRHAIEVKVSRADLCRELESGKWEAWAAVTHRFWLAVPKALSLDGIVLPDSWGVLAVDGRGVRKAVKAPKREPADLPEACWVEALRRASRAEARIRQASGGAARIAALEAELAASDRRYMSACQSRDRLQRQRDDVMQLLAGVHPAPPCVCGAALKPLRRGSLRWEHDGVPGPSRSRYVDGPCDYPRVDTDALCDSVLPHLAETTTTDGGMTG